MLATPLEKRIRAMLEPSLVAMGYEVVLVRMSDGGKRKLLRIIAERRDGVAMAIEDCEQISIQSSALLDVEDPIADAYQLEVSSPGLDRPLTRKEDFKRFEGEEAKIELVMPLEGRKRFRGKINGLKGEEVVLSTTEGEKMLALSLIRNASLVITEEVFRKALKKK